MKTKMNSTEATVPTHPSSHESAGQFSRPPDAGRIYLVLNDCTCVDPAFYKRMLEHVRERVPTLAAGSTRSLRQICDPTFWALLNNGERRVAGRCVSHMVVKGEVDLATVQQRHEYPKKYCRR